MSLLVLMVSCSPVKYSKQELAKEKTAVEDYLSKKYPEAHFIVTIEQEYKDRIDPGYPYPSAGWYIIRKAEDENGIMVSIGTNGNPGPDGHIVYEYKDDYEEKLRRYTEETDSRKILADVLGISLNDDVITEIIYVMEHYCENTVKSAYMEPGLNEYGRITLFIEDKDSIKHKFTLTKELEIFGVEDMHTNKTEYVNEKFITIDS